MIGDNGRPFIRDRKIRMALVGCGRISGKHFDAIQAHAAEVDLVGVCDTSPPVLEQTMRRVGAPGYERLDRMLEASEPDLVVICTPSGLHAGQVMACAGRGCHVMTEKPMATRWPDGLRMVEACDRAGVHLFVVKQNRRNTTLQLLKRALVKKRFGRVHMVAINVFWSRPQTYYDQDAWRGTWEFDGGALMNQASHYVDLLDWLIGPVESVQAFTATLGRDIEVEDTATLNIRWRSGTLGSMSVTMLTYPRNYEASITIIGEQGTARVGGVAVNEIQHWDFADPDADDRIVEGASYATDSVYGFGHPRYYENVIQSLRGEAVPETDGREGLRSLEILIASYISARDGRKVSLPLEY